MRWPPELPEESGHCLQTGGIKRLAEITPFFSMTSGSPLAMRCTLTFGDIYGQVLAWPLDLAPMCHIRISTILHFSKDGLRVLGLSEHFMG